MKFKVHLSRPDITDAEINAVTEVMKTPNLSLGPKLAEFENAFTNYIGKKRAVAVNSGTSALYICLKALNIGPGHEVITTPFTFISSTTCIMMTGAKPVMVDIDPTSLNIDYTKIESSITENTKAILPVEVFGNPTGMDQIEAIAKKHNIPIIEDSCEALGSKLNSRLTGTYGTFSTFAFYPNKQITTGEGGILLTDNDDLADTCMALRNQGRNPRSTSWLAHEMLGYNYRLSDINCALGIVQLSRIKEIKQKRKRSANLYLDALADESRITLPHNPENVDMSWFVFVVRLNGKFSDTTVRDNILNCLREKGIACSNYFTPVHLQPFIAEKYSFKVGDYPVTDDVCKRTIALPFHNHLTKEDVSLVCDSLRQCLDKFC